MADALGPLAALDGQAGAAGLVAVHPAGCGSGGQWRQREGPGGEGRSAGERGGRRERRPGGARGGEGESAGAEEARWEEGEEGGQPGTAGRGGRRESDRVRPGVHSKQEDERGRRRRRRWAEAGARTRHADAGTLAHADCEADGARQQRRQPAGV